MPDEEITLLGEEELFLKPTLLDLTSHVIRKLFYLRVVLVKAASREPVVRYVIASGIEAEWASVWSSVLERRPCSDEAELADGGHVERVEMIDLLTTLVEVQSVDHHRLVFKELGKDHPDPFGHCGFTKPAIEQVKIVHLEPVLPLLFGEPADTAPTIGDKVIDDNVIRQIAPCSSRGSIDSGCLVFVKETREHEESVVVPELLSALSDDGHARSVRILTGSEGHEPSGASGMPPSGRIGRQSPQLDTSPEARIEWYETRTAALERQIDCRIGQVQELEQQAKDLEQQLKGLEQQLNDIAAIAGDDLGLLIAKAKGYDELMQTRTLRILRRPRAAYAWLRRLNRDRHT
jgi:hypothetical protein